MRRLRKVPLDVTPGKLSIEQYVGAVIGMNRRTPRFIGLLSVDDVGQRLIVHTHFLAGIFSERARLGDNSSDPFSRVTAAPHSQRVTPHPRRIQAVISGSVPFASSSPART